MRVSNAKAAIYCVLMLRGIHIQNTEPHRYHSMQEEKVGMVVAHMCYSLSSCCNIQHIKRIGTPTHIFSTASWAATTSTTHHGDIYTTDHKCVDTRK